MAIYSYYRPLETVVAGADEREPGYRTELLKCAKRVLQHEEQHRIKHIAIKQEVEKDLDKLVDFLVKARGAK